MGRLIAVVSAIKRATNMCSLFCLALVICTVARIALAYDGRIGPLRVIENIVVRHVRNLIAIPRDMRLGPAKNVSYIALRRIFGIGFGESDAVPF